MDNVHDLAVAKIRTILLEGESQNEDSGVPYHDAPLSHQLDDLLGDIGSHAVVDAAAGENHLRVVADLGRFVRQIIRIHPDAVAAHQAWAERQEVPLRAGGPQDFLSVDPDPIENERQFIDEGDVHIPLGVFDHLGGLRDLDAGGLVGACSDDRGIKCIHQICDPRLRPGGDLFDVRQAVLLIAGVDPFRAVATIEVPVEAQRRISLQYRYANFLRAAGIDGRFVYDDIAL